MKAKPWDIDISISKKVVAATKVHESRMSDWLKNLRKCVKRDKRIPEGIKIVVHFIDKLPVDKPQFLFHIQSNHDVKLPRGVFEDVEFYFKAYTRDAQNWEPFYKPVRKVEGTKKVVTRVKHEGLNANRLNRPGSELERFFAQAWEDGNKEALLAYILSDGTQLHQDEDLTQRDATVAASVIQWLGTNAGQSFITGVMLFSEERQPPPTPPAEKKPDPNLPCPECGEPEVCRCRCLRSERSCKNGHSWQYDSIQGKNVPCTGHH
jgi:hypothetical protein